MIWLYAYLAAGAVFCAGVFGIKRSGLLRDTRDTAPWPVVAIVLVLLWPVWAYYWATASLGEIYVRPEKAPPQFAVRPRDLQEVLTIDAIEARELVMDPLGAVPGLPFGHINAGWAQFKVQLQPGSEICSFSRKFRNSTSTRYEGYVEVSNGVVERWFISRKFEA